MDQVKQYILSESKTLIFPGDEHATITYATEEIVTKANEAIAERGQFTIALSGGSTPKKIYQMLKTPKYRDRIDYSKVYVFFGDERSVAPTNPDSNYKMALDNGISELGIPVSHIYRMRAEGDIEQGAKEYELILKELVADGKIDFVMLGMGDDGHTASLFPNTKALSETTRMVVPNEVPQKKTLRMTMTHTCINNAKHISLYIIGSAKTERLESVLFSEEPYPSKNVGTKATPANWIIDDSAKKGLQNLPT
jgi:6-phosphogluconolactonase